jgi:hypothetical protein
MPRMTSSSCWRIARHALQGIVELCCRFCRVVSMRIVAPSSALAAFTIDWPWFVERLVTPEICCATFSDTPSARLPGWCKPSMALKRLTGDAVAGAAHCVDAAHIDWSIVLTCWPSVSDERAHMILHGEGERARLLTDRVVDGRRRAQHRVVEQRQALEKAASSARVRSTSCMSSASARLASVASSATV